MRFLALTVLFAAAPAASAQDVVVNRPGPAESVHRVGLEGPLWSAQPAPGTPRLVRAVAPGERASRLRAAAEAWAAADDDPARVATPAEAERLVRHLAAAARAASGAEREASVAALEAALVRQDELRLAQQQAYLDRLRARVAADAAHVGALEAALEVRRAAQPARVQAERRRLIGF